MRRTRSVLGGFTAITAGGVLVLGVFVNPATATADDSFYTYSGSTPLAELAPGTVLRTRTLPYHDRTFSIQFDFIEHQLVIHASDDETRTLALRPQTVADFYREVMMTLDGMGLPVKIWTMPSEVPSPIRFEQDTVHHSYDPEYANRCWRIFSQAARVLALSQCL